MVAESQQRNSEARSSWRELFQGLPLKSETARFFVASALDVVLTYLLIRQPPFHEANPFARYFLHRWGVEGMIYFKLAMVGLVILIAQIIARKRLGTARWLLNVATVIVVCVLAYSLVLLFRHGEPLF